MAGDSTRGSSVASHDAVPHSVHDAIDAHGWIVRAASRRGIGGDGRNPRQDAYALRRGNGRIAVVVCDGLGALEHSHLAANAAATALADHLLTAHIDISGDWTTHLRVASLAVTRAAATVLGQRAPDRWSVTRIMATTATAVVVDGIDTEPPWLVHTATVGDSSVWWRRTRAGALGFDPWLLMSGGPQPPREHDAVLPLPDGTTVTGASYEIGPEELLMVCSDGVADAFDDGSSRIAASFASGWSNPPRISDLAERIAFDERRVPGDRTAVGVWTPR